MGDLPHINDFFAQFYIKWTVINDFLFLMVSFFQTATDVNKIQGVDKIMENTFSSS